jgi:hypothetical protein
VRKLPIAVRTSAFDWDSQVSNSISVPDWVSQLRPFAQCVIAATFVNDPLRRQQLPEEFSLNRRLRLVIQYLREETGSAAA